MENTIPERTGIYFFYLPKWGCGSLEGKFIRSWSSATLAAKTLKISRNAISHCLVGLNKSSNNFIWKYGG